MRSLLILSIIALFSLSTAISQEYTPYTLPEVTPEMFEGEEFEDDPDAEAVYLARCATSMLEFISSAPTRVYRYKARIRLYDEEAVEKFKEFSLSYNSTRGIEDLKDINVQCHNLTKRGKVETSKTKEKYFSENTIERKQNGQKYKYTTVTIPVFNVEVGSIIDLEYTKYTPSIAYPNRWEYQKQYPVKYSEYIYETLNMMDFERIENGDQYIDVDEEYEGEGVRNEQGTLMSTTVFFTSIPDLPAFKSYSYLDSYSDYITNISFFLKGVNQGEYQSNIVTWDEQIKQYNESEVVSDFYADAEIEVPNITMDLGLDDMFEARNIIKTVHEYIKENYECTDGFGNIPDKKWGELMKDKEGDAATMNHLFAAILKEVGYDVTPLCVSPRSAGKLDMSKPTQMSLPFMILFVEADGEEFYVDASMDYLKWDMLHYVFTDTQGLLFGEGGINWKIPPIIDGTSSKTTFKGTIDPSKTDEKANKVEVTITGRGYDAYQFNSQYDQLEELDSLHLFKKGLERAYSDSIDGDITFSNMKSIKVDPIIKFNAYFNTEEEDGAYVIEPFFGEAENFVKDFKANERFFPIQFSYPEESIYEIDLTIPAGYTIESAPESKEFKKADGTITLTYNFEKKSDTNFVITVVTNYKQRVYDYKEYKELKTIHDGLAELMNTPIKVKK